MSASTEVLLEQILKTRAALAEAETNGNTVSASDLKQYLVELNKKLEANNVALNEGTQVLKG